MWEEAPGGSQYPMADIFSGLQCGRPAGRDQFIAEFEAWTSGLRSSKWPVIGCALVHGVRSDAFEDWLGSYQKRYFLSGGTIREWPLEGLPEYSREDTRRRWDVIERCGWHPEDADPLSLVEAESQQVDPASQILLEWPEDVACEAIIRAPMFWSWTWADLLFSGCSALEVWARSDGWVRGVGAATTSDLLGLFDFSGLKSIARKCGIEPLRSTAATRELLAGRSEISLDLLLRALADRHGQRELVRVSPPAELPARTLLLARAYARGLVCYLRERGGMTE